jgi:hypothetical protein
MCGVVRAASSGEASGESRSEVIAYAILMLPLLASLCPSVMDIGPPSMVIACIAS